MLSIETWKCIALMFGALSSGVGLGWALRGYRFAVRGPDKLMTIAQTQEYMRKLQLERQRAVEALNRAAARGGK